MTLKGQIQISVEMSCFACKIRVLLLDRFSFDTYSDTERLLASHVMSNISINADSLNKQKIQPIQVATFNEYCYNLKL